MGNRIDRSDCPRIGNKGLTMVELLIVMIILSLAVVFLAPYIHRFINRYRGSELLPHADKAYKAVQTQIAAARASAPQVSLDPEKAYTVSTIVNEEHEGAGNRTVLDKAADMAEMPTGSGFYFMTAKPEASSTTDNGSWGIKYFVYYEGTEGAYYDGNAWIEMSKYKAEQTIKNECSRQGREAGEVHRYAR